VSAPFAGNSTTGICSVSVSSAALEISSEAFAAAARRSSKPPATWRTSPSEGEVAKAPSPRSPVPGGMTIQRPVKDGGGE